MTDKEFKKLNRRELLQILLEQARRADQLQEKLTELDGKYAELQEGYDRLKVKLDEKDAQILEIQGHSETELAALESANARLRSRLDEKDVTIQQLREERDNITMEFTNVGSLAEAALKLNRVFEDAQKAADQYIAGIVEACKDETTKQYLSQSTETVTPVQPTTPQSESVDIKPGSIPVSDKKKRFTLRGGEPPKGAWTLYMGIKKI